MCKWTDLVGCAERSVVNRQLPTLQDKSVNGLSQTHTPGVKRGDPSESGQVTGRPGKLDTDWGAFQKLGQTCNLILKELASLDK